MLTQHIQLHHGFNSTNNTTKQKPNVHLLMFHPNPDPTPENITKITAVKTVQEHNEGTEKFTALFVALLLP